MLCCDDEEPPWAGMWIKPPKSLRIDLDTARRRLGQEARRVLGRERGLYESGTAAIEWYYDLSESRERLLSALTKNGGQEFFKIMVSHLKSLGPLIPVIDAVFSRSGRHGK
jgi:hypothetical protein